MNNDVQRAASCCLFQVEGPLRADHLEGLCELACAGGDGAPRDVLLDCRGVTRFDADALAALARFEARVRSSGGQWCVWGLEEPRFTQVLFWEARPPFGLPLG